MIKRDIPKMWVLNLLREWLKKLNGIVGGWALQDFKHIVFERVVFKCFHGVTYHIVGTGRRNIGDVASAIPCVSQQMQEEEIKEAIDYFLALEEHAIEQVTGLLPLQNAIEQGAWITGELKKEGDNERYFLFTCYSSEAEPHITL